MRGAIDALSVTDGADILDFDRFACAEKRHDGKESEEAPVGRRCGGKLRENQTPQEQEERPKGEKVKAEGKAIGQAEVLSTETVFEGPLFRVTRDKLIEPGGKEAVRDVVRHNGSAVILAIDNSKDKKDPWVVMERQYRHAARRFLWEVPAGKLDPGEDPLEGAKRELEEETGYRAKKWTELVEYYASPGFLGESMKVFLAAGLVPG